MNEPTPIGRVIDGAMRNLLGDDGFDTYVVLCRQTQEARARIVADVRETYQSLLAAEMVRRVAGHPAYSPSLIAVDARLAVEAMIRQETARQIANEERLFRDACQALFAWTQERKRPDCPGRGD